MWDRVNVHRLEVHSDESGALNPETCADGTTPFAASASTAVSYFDAEYCASGLRRALVVDTGKVLLEVGALVPEVDVVLVLVNHVEPGGTGSPGIAVCNVGGIYDGTATHEIGHSAFGLADEYEYYAGCGSGETAKPEFWARRLHQAAAFAVPRAWVFAAPRLVVKYVDREPALTDILEQEHQEQQGCG